MRWVLPLAIMATILSADECTPVSHTPPVPVRTGFNLGPTVNGDCTKPLLGWNVRNDSINGVDPLTSGSGKYGASREAT